MLFVEAKIWGGVKIGFFYLKLTALFEIEAFSKSFTSMVIL
jgi:hypothetical protein